ncbi:MAG TPA: DoxX family protein, partial [Steroidobacteraceae bacterium]|nr:DoxX family protein [Steroidobacteraceae bacterium]
SRIARVIFGICLIYFGLAHHFYLANTVSMVPAWLPPGQTFWAYATGAGHIAAGLAIISGVYARLGAVLLTAMFILFTILVHAPRVLLTLPHNHFAWGENAVNFALIGSAWVVAASIPPVVEAKA